MKYLIEYVCGPRDDPYHGTLIVEAEDVRQALRLVETNLDISGAKVDAVNPVED